MDVGYNLQLTPETIHYGKLTCQACGFFLGWASMPENESKRTKTSRLDIDNFMLRRYKTNIEPFCFFCLRSKEQLGLHETLTLDHIEELSIGGLDEEYNLQVLCSACHKLKNWARLYMNWHLNKVGKNGDTTTTEGQ